MVMRPWPELKGPGLRVEASEGLKRVLGTLSLQRCPWSSPRVLSLSGLALVLMWWGGRQSGLHWPLTGGGGGHRQLLLCLLVGTQGSASWTLCLGHIQSRYIHCRASAD